MGVAEKAKIWDSGDELSSPHCATDGAQINPS